MASAEEDKKTPDGWTEMLKMWPKRTLCIMGSEFCERFSYYGMRAVLMLYALNVLRFSADSSTMLFNGLTVVCFLTPVFGSILADGYIGKFKTILYLSLLYSCGQLVLAFASTQDAGSPLHPWLDLLGLAIVALGTGGIKPCVNSFGADQFETHQARMVSLFFSVFYFSINIGSSLTFLTPMLRATACLGRDSCYPLAFGVPCALMVIAILFFVAGSPWYKKRPPSENVFAQFYRVGKRALVNRCHSGRGKRHSHWLDHFFDTHQCSQDQSCAELQREKGMAQVCPKRQFVADLKSLLRLLVMFLPAPVFWALFDQQGSRWVLQSVMMDCRLWGDRLLLPDQMHPLSAFLILVYIPLFQTLVYPAVSRCVSLTPLRKMVAGGLLASLAFAMSACVQFQVNKTLADIPPFGRAFVSAMNTFDHCSLRVCASGAVDGREGCRTLAPNQTLTNPDRSQRELFDVKAGPRNWTMQVLGDSAECQFGGKTTIKSRWHLDGGGTFYILAGKQGVLLGRASTAKPTEGKGAFSVGFTLALENTDFAGDLALCRRPRPCNPQRAEDFYVWRAADGDLEGVRHFQGANGSRGRSAALYKYKSVRGGSWQLFLLDARTLTEGRLNLTDTGVQLDVGAQGGVYLVALTGHLHAKNKAQKRVFRAVPDNAVSILWQLPQIAVITAAEILFSITGYEFAYSQAAPSMKALVQSCWLLTIALGDAHILLCVSLIKFSNMAHEFLFYAALMVAVMAILGVLAVFFYDYNYYTGAHKSSSVHDRRIAKEAEEKSDGDSQF